MSGEPDVAGFATRRIAYTLMMVVAGSIAAWAILRAPSAFSVNDLSRWATVRALVDSGTYSIGERHHLPDGGYEDRGIMFEPDWYTIDAVLNPETQRFYSSKPLLLPTVLAGEYWLLRQVFGWTITHDRRHVYRAVMMTINWAPFVLYLIVLARLTERLGSTDWGRLFVLTSACFGTFVSGFLTTLNNHTVAAVAALFGVYQCLRIHLDDDRRWWRFLLAGLFAGWTACNELPAASLAAGLIVWVMRLSWRDTLRFALPGMILPIAAYLYLQFEAFGSIVPTYGKAAWYQFPGSYWLRPWGIDGADDAKLLYAFNLLAGHSGILSLTPILLLGWIGMVRGARLRPWRVPDFTPQSALATLTLALTIVVFVFYVFGSNNYGGVTAGPRWFIWLMPLWLLTMVSEADRWGSFRWRRGLACFLLGISIGSVMFAQSNPWRHSWLFTLLQERGIVSYQ